MTDSNLTRLEEEGDIAADYLEELLDICDLDGDIDMDVENGRAAVEIVSEEFGDRWLKKLVGDDGRVLDALQELTRLAVQAKTGDRSRLMLDVAGYRAGVKEDLAADARDAVAEVERTGEKVRMKPMNPFERKVVHDVVKAAGLSSESEGAEPNRRVVIMPAAGGVAGSDAAQSADSPAVESADGAESSESPAEAGDQVVPEAETNGEGQSGEGDAAAELQDEAASDDATVEAGASEDDADDADAVPTVDDGDIETGALTGDGAVVVDEDPERRARIADAMAVSSDTIDDDAEYNEDVQY